MPMRILCDIAPAARKSALTIASICGNDSDDCRACTYYGRFHATLVADSFHDFALLMSLGQELPAAVTPIIYFITTIIRSG